MVPLAILEMDSSIDPTQFLIDYSGMFNANFKQRLSSIITTDTDRDLFDQIWNDDHKLTYIRRLTDLINKMNYLKLQDEQWTYFHQLGINDGIWTGRISKKTATANSMCHIYGRSKHITIQRQKKYKDEYQEMNEKIEKYTQHIPFPIDLNKIMAVLNELIHNDQHQLRLTMQKQRDMLKFDTNEHQLVKTFYDLKPRNSEIRSAKFIWKLVNEQQLLRNEMDIYKTWLSLKPQSTQYTIQDLELKKINDIFIQQAYRAELNPVHLLSNDTNSNQLKNSVDQLSHLTLSKAEELIQNYTIQIDKQRTNLLSNRGQFKKPPTVDDVVIAIENRRLNMIARHNYKNQYIKKMLFDSSISKTTNTESI